MDEKQIEGVRDGYMAFREESHISVHDDEGDWLFTLPTSFDSQAVNAAIGAYVHGFNRGERAGDFGARSRICAALGIDGPKFSA